MKPTLGLLNRLRHTPASKKLSSSRRPSAYEAAIAKPLV